MSTTQVTSGRLWRRTPEQPAPPAARHHRALPVDAAVGQPRLDASSSNRREALSLDNVACLPNAQSRITPQQLKRGFRSEDPASIVRPAGQVRHNIQRDGDWRTRTQLPLQFRVVVTATRTNASNTNPVHRIALVKPDLLPSVMDDERCLLLDVIAPPVAPPTRNSADNLGRLRLEPAASWERGKQHDQRLQVPPEAG